MYNHGDILPSYYYQEDICFVCNEAAKHIYDDVNGDPICEYCREQKNLASGEMLGFNQGEKCDDLSTTTKLAV